MAARNSPADPILRRKDGPLRPWYLDRDMKVYQMGQNDIDQLSTATAEQAVSTSVATAFASAALSCFLAGLSGTQALTLVQIAAFQILPPILLINSLVFAYQAYLKAKQRQSVFRIIERESKRALLLYEEQTETAKGMTSGDIEIAPTIPRKVPT